MNLVTEPVKMLDLALRWFAMDTKEILSKHPAVTREHVTQNDAAQSMVDFFPQLNPPRPFAPSPQKGWRILLIYYDAFHLRKRLALQS